VELGVVGAATWPALGILASRATVRAFPTFAAVLAAAVVVYAGLVTAVALVG
jgi:hypothetical protein